MEGSFSALEHSFGVGEGPIRTRKTKGKEMTEQYLQTNINNPTLPRAVAATVAAPAIALTPDDSLVVIDTDLAAGTANLPLASTMPGRAITVVNSGALPLGLTLAVLAGDTLVEPAAAGALNPMAAGGGSLTAVSDGGTHWYLTNAQA